MAFEGFRVVGTRERPTLNQAGQPANEVIIDIVTDNGATGQLILPQRVYEAATDEELAGMLIEKANKLDRAMSL